MKAKSSAYISKWRYWLSQHWHGVIATVIISALAVFTLGLQLNTLVNGQNAYETATLVHLESFPNPTERIINAPYLIPAYIIGSLLDNMLMGARVTSVVFSLLATWALFSILRRWFTVQLASVGSLLFITSSWVLAISHQATPFILLVISPLLLIAALAKFVNYKGPSIIGLTLLLGSIVFSLYTPFMLWPIAIVFILLFMLYKKKLIDMPKKYLYIALSIVFLLLIPLIISLWQYPGQIKEMAGIPLVFPTLEEYGKNFIWQFSTLFYLAEPFPILYVGKMPLLDIFSAAMVLLGVYHFIKFAPKRRRLSLGLLTVILMLIIPLSIPYQIPMSTYVAIVYILIASGIYELLRQWFSYFPRNPFARNAAVIIVVLTIGLATFYNLQRFYVAWPNSPETKAAYMIQSNSN